MGDANLFGEPAGAQAKTPKREPVGEARLLKPDRHQMRLVPTDLDSLLDFDHRARSIWRVVENLDLSKLVAPIRSRGDNAGRPAIDPKVLLALWLYGLSNGVGAARELERLCEAHDGYRWICGGVHVNYHTLSDFRANQAEAIDELFTQILGVMLHNGLVSLDRVAQDGMRMRASAGAASFRREKSLRRCLLEAKDHVRVVTKEAQDAAVRTRQDAARVRAAEEREERVQKALEQLPEVIASKRTSKGKDVNVSDVRVSTTDPDARVMKMPDGGFRPAYNVQFTTAVEGRAILGVRVSNSGSDYGQLPASLDELQQRTGRLPQKVLADSAYASRKSIDDAGRRNVLLYAPPKPSDPNVRKCRDSEHVAAWRDRMTTDEAKELYKLRAAVAETVHADLRSWRGFDRIPVRGLARARSAALLAALAYNVLLCINHATHSTK